MESGVFRLPDVAPGIIVAWGIGIFAIWFLYRHNPYFSRAKMVTSSLSLTALLFFVLLYFWYRDLPPANPARVAVFAMVDESSGQGRISPLSLLIPEITTAALSGNEKELLPYRLHWLLEVLQADSLSDRGYLRRLSKELGLDYAFWGSFRAAGDGGAEVEISWEAYRPSKDKTVRRWRSRLALGSLSRSAQEMEQLISSGSMNDGVRRTPFDGLPAEQIRAYAEAEYFRWQHQSRPMYAAVERAAGPDSSFTPALLLWAEGLIDSAAARRERGLEEEAYPYFRAAKRLLLKALEADSTNATACRLLGTIYLWNERWTEAENYLIRSQRYNWWQPRLYTEVSRLHPSRYPAFGVENERKLYERAIYIFPGYLEAYLDLANYYEFRHQWKRSIEVLETYLRLNPNSVDALMALGRLYVNHHDLIDILRVYQRIVDLDPGNADAYYDLGVAYYNHEDFDTAEKFFKKAIEVSDHLNSHLYLAIIYKERGDEDKAVEELRYRLKHRRGRNDRYAEEARKVLFEIMSKRGLPVNKDQP